MNITKKTNCCIKVLNPPLKLKIMLLKKITLKNIISLLFLSMLFIPIYEVFVPYENKPENECWELTFVWEDFITFLSYSLFAIVWFLNLYIQNKFLKIILIIFAIINLIGTFLAGSMPSQDLIFSLGMPIYMILCLCVLFYIIKIENRKKATSANSCFSQLRILL